MDTDHRDLVCQLIIEVFLSLTSTEEDDEERDGVEMTVKVTCQKTGRISEFTSCAGESVDFDAQDGSSQDLSGTGNSRPNCSPEKNEEERSVDSAGDGSCTVAMTESGDGSGPDSLTVGSFSRQMSINSPSPRESSECIRNNIHFKTLFIVLVIISTSEMSYQFRSTKLMDMIFRTNIE